MKSITFLLGVGVIASLGLSVISLKQRFSFEATSPEGAQQLQASVDKMAGSLAMLQQQVDQLQKASPESVATATGETESVRLEALESGLIEIQNRMKALDLGETMAEKEALFRGEFGYEKADELAALGNHALAGNGYLQFLEAHPDHPDARDIMKNAREAYLKAGYRDKASWVQSQLMERYPERISDDAYKMALMLKQEKRYDEALEFVDQAAEAATNDVERLWRLSYRAFLIQQRDGNAAGVDAFREFEAQVNAANLTDDKLGAHARERIADLEKRVAEQGL